MALMTRAEGTSRLPTIFEIVSCTFKNLRDLARAFNLTARLPRSRASTGSKALL